MPPNVRLATRHPKFSRLIFDRYRERARRTLPSAYRSSADNLTLREDLLAGTPNGVDFTCSTGEMLDLWRIEDPFGGVSHL